MKFLTVILIATFTSFEIYVEIERARLTRMLAKIKEDQGDIAGNFCFTPFPFKPYVRKDINCHVHLSFCFSLFSVFSSINNNLW